MTLREYLAAVHQLTGLSEVESFWVHSVLLSVEVFCLVALMAWAFVRVSRYVQSLKTRAIRVVIPWALLAVYCLLVMTTMLLFFEHAQIRKSWNEASARQYGLVGAALAFFIIGWSPMVYLQWRKGRLNANGA
jgi:hypothetical protein